MKKLIISKDIKKLIRETCEDYRKEFRKHRQDITHLSKCGKYQEREAYKYRDRED